jgi:hypothetical protein
MTFIPQTRPRYKEEPLQSENAASGNKEFNPYWEGYLSNERKVAVAGYDFAVENAIKTFFSNTIGSEDEPGEWEDIENMLGVEFENDGERTLARDIIEALRDSLKEWCENTRDELVVSMIDEMFGDEYERIRSREDAETRRMERLKDRGEAGSTNIISISEKEIRDGEKK